MGKGTMAKLRRFVPLVFVSVIVVCTSTRAGNAFPTAMPDFQISRDDGTTLSSTQIPQSGKWLFVYLKQNCAGCERFLRIFNKVDNPALPPHVVVVVGGMPPDKLDALISKFPELAQAQWYADPGESAVSPLQIKGSPIIFGVHDSTLNWSIVGVPGGDSRKLKAIFKSWATP